VDVPCAHASRLTATEQAFCNQNRPDALHAVGFILSAKKDMLQTLLKSGLNLSEGNLMADQTKLRAYVSLGSNCDNAAEKLAAALDALAELPEMGIGAVSPVYRTEPQEYTEQPWFLNQVVELFPGDSWRPCSLVDALLDIEARLGRVRSPDPVLRFGPRVIDVDLLLFGQERSTDPHCLVPHPRLTVRAFVMRPLLDIAPLIVVDGLPVRDWLARTVCRVEGDRIFQ